MKSGPLYLALLPLVSGCVVHAAYDVATAPVRATSWTVDKLTTSQAEADRNRGRRERKAEKREAKAERKVAKQQREQAKRERRQAVPTY